jgi:hypothetical protein
LDLGNIDVEIAERVGLELALARCGGLDIGKSGDPDASQPQESAQDGCEPPLRTCKTSFWSSEEPNTRSTSRAKQLHWSTTVVILD